MPTPTTLPTTPPTAAPTRRPIIFYSVRDDPATQAANADLFSVDPVTAVEQRLTTETEPDSDPAWSPNGTRIAFDSRRAGGRRDIWVLEADGLFSRITDSSPDDALPVWSPDGEMLAWSRGAAGSREIWVGSSRDGSGAHRVTSGHDDIFPSWSSAGLIAFQRRDASSEIWVVDPDRSGAVVRITAGQGGGATPAWSPDGRRIAFVRLVGGVNRIYIVNADGVTSLHSLTSAAVCDCEHPAWSRDGTQMAFVGPKGTVRGIYVVSAAGGTPRRVTTNGLAPFWGS